MGRTIITDRRAGVPSSLWSLVGALAAAGAAAALILADRLPPAGVAVAAAAIAVTVSGRRAKYADESRLVFADSAAERVVDAVVLGTLAWTRADDPALAAAALTALVLGYLAAYVRARATGLGFPVRESIIARSMRAALLVVGLAVAPVLTAALWLAAAVSLFSVIREAVEVNRPGLEGGR